MIILAGHLRLSLDGQVVSAPVIQSQIFGSGQITGDFTVAETNELALILRAGALPAPLIVMEETVNRAGAWG